tara:strand:- start:57869 stop:58600 length:732 start_codon:yes stop_codon:yes gene_type:complete
MKLILDIGNSLIKLAVFDSKLQIEYRSFKEKELKTSLSKVLKDYPNINFVVVSSVSTLKKNKIKIFFDGYKILFLDSKVRLPFNSLYETTETLGADRIALVAAAHYIYPNQNVLIIDTGTCITYDFIDKNSNYHGGSISPGLMMRYKSLYHLTENLPNLNPTTPEYFIGYSTHSSIHTGVVLGAVTEIEGMVSMYKKKYPDLKVVVTGGDSNFLCKQFKISIFAISNFLMEGLNFLSEANFKE